MKLKQRMDIMELTKRGILVDRVKVIHHIMKGITNKFNVDIIYAYLNPIFNDLTDYIIVGYMRKDEKIIIFHAVSFGECSTAQFDMYAAHKNIEEFYDNMKQNATCYPVKVFEALMRQKGLSTNKSDSMYWGSTDKAVSKIVVEAFEDLSPVMSQAKVSKRRGR